jgi:hypothetical protein
LSFFVFIYSINEHKKGPFEPAGLGKLFAKHFSFKLQFEIYLVSTKPLVVPETI